MIKNLSKNFKKLFSFILVFSFVLSSSARASFFSDPFGKRSDVIIDIPNGSISSGNVLGDNSILFNATDIGTKLDLSRFNIKFPERIDVDESILSSLSNEHIETGYGPTRTDDNIPLKAFYYRDKYGDLGGVFIADVKEGEKKIYLTFDCGYEIGHTFEILDALKEKNVRAVFFITGYYARDSEDHVRRMIDDGHIVGNHTWSHIDCARSTLKEMQNNIFELHDFVKNKFDYEMKLFRYPYGNFSEQTLKYISMQGYKQIFWTFGYKDYDTQNQPTNAYGKMQILTAACPGNIYLLHAESKTNASILAECIDEIRASGFTIGDPIDLLIN